MRKQYLRRVALGGVILGGLGGLGGAILGLGPGTAAHPTARAAGHMSGMRMPMARPATTTRGGGMMVRLHQAVVRVTIHNFAFGPARLVVSPGTRVVWTNTDSDPHTVSSNKGDWSSDALDTGNQFARVFSTAGTFPYHCNIHPTMTATVIVSSTGASSGSGGSGGTAGNGSGMSAMGPMSTTSMTAWTGYYDSHKVLFISTDTSNKDEATRDHINDAPGLTTSLRYTVPIYLIANGAYAGRGPVFGSQPGEKDYTPLWQEVTVTWKDPGKAVALGSDTQITGLAKAGTLTLMTTGTVLNCPIIKVMGGS